MIALEPSPRSKVGAVLVVAGLLTSGIVLFGTGSGPDPPRLTITESTVGPPGGGEITLHVSGEVAAPGLVAVSAQARVADAIAAAGGSTPAADLGAINLAATVRDGDHIVVPAISSESPGGALVRPAGDARVRVNAASVDELQQLPGVGPVLAARIVDHREAHGPFTTVEDLLDVPGIGEAKLASLRDAVAVP